MSRTCRARGLRGTGDFELVPGTVITLDLTVLPLMREWTHLPIAASADGVAVGVHRNPSEARSDGPQALLPAELVGLVSDTRILAAVTGRRLHAPPD